jgi:hypothetical protein
MAAIGLIGVKKPRSTTKGPELANVPAYGRHFPEAAALMHDVRCWGTSDLADAGV